MSYKTILAYLAKADGIQSVMDTALPLAGRFGAHLIGTHVMPGVPSLGTMGAQVSPEIIEQFAQQMREEAAAIKASFADAVEGARIQTEWRQQKQKVLGMDILHLISEQTRSADIVVMGQTDSAQRAGDLNADVIIAAGRPVVVVPKTGGATDLTGKIVVAWDGSREATRAAFDSLPLLKEAQSVFVVTIQKRNGKDQAVPGCEELAHTLARHGAKAEAVTLDSEKSAGEALSKFASEKDCDLMVMGCYGHSRLRERLFGGATQHMLQNMILPVLMSH